MGVAKPVDVDFFKFWSPEMAYVLGFFFADGSYDVNRRGSEYFSFQMCDYELLTTIRAVMQSGHKLAIRSPQRVNESVQYRLQIGSKAMCADLRAHGIDVKKAHVMAFPKVPYFLLSDFIRGYFDGDGNVWSGNIHPKRKRQMKSLLVAFTSCSQSFLVGLQKVLVTQGMGEGSLFACQGAYRLQYSAKDSIILYQIIYKNVCNQLYLPRKKKVFEVFMKEKKIQLRS